MCNLSERHRCHCATIARRQQAFTLVEILIVVVILGILAAIVIPQFTSAAEQSRENACKMSLFRIRTQLEVYREQHNGKYPNNADDDPSFVQHMTMATDAHGNTAPPGTPGFRFGPYLREIPVNPEDPNGDNDISQGVAGTSAWYYNQDTGQFLANHSDVARLW